MGMYDIILVKCPICKKEYELQSKSGQCLLKIYTLEDCPEDVLEDANRHAPYYCECGAKFNIDISTRKLNS